LPVPFRVRPNASSARADWARLRIVDQRRYGEDFRDEQGSLSRSALDPA
jgi:hypothetical protein